MAVRPEPEALGRLQSALARASAQHVVSDEKRSSGTHSASTATARTSAQIATSPEFPEDPKPAAARRSGATRSRTSRPSVKIAATQRPNELAADVPVTHLSPARINAGLPERELPQAETSPARPAREPFDAAGGRPEDEPIAIAASARPAAAKTALPSASRVKAVGGMVAASVLLVLYAFEIGTLEGAANAAAAHVASGGAGSTATQAFASVLPWLLVLPALALFGFIVWLLAGIIGVRRISKGRSRVLSTKLPKLPLNQFREAADRHGIENRTAYRTWRLLETACAADREIRVESSLSADLALTDKEVRTIHLALLSELSRVSDPSLRLPPTETVLDLMLAAEDAPLMRTAPRSGDVVIPGDPGGPRRRN